MKMSSRRDNNINAMIFSRYALNIVWQAQVKLIAFTAELPTFQAMLTRFAMLLMYETRLGPDRLAFQAELLVLGKERGMCPADNRACHRCGSADNRKIALGALQLSRGP